VKRVRLTMKQYAELVESREWCSRNGYEAMKRWYDEELAFQTRRRALPVGVQPEFEEIEERPRGRW
jgi:hypothetical protein